MFVFELDLGHAMSFHEQIDSINEFYFFREFTFARTTFKPTPQSQLELADSIVWLDTLLLVYQVKERDVRGTTTPEAERKWYERKVIGKATKQIRDTLGYIKNHSTIDLTNLRGHSFGLSGTQIKDSHNLVVYDADELLPADCLMQKYHFSRTAGLIHLIPAHDYLGILRTLQTPAEVSEYLHFRSALASRFAERLASVPEKALVGQYIAEEPWALPHRRFEYYLEQLQHNAVAWDISRIIRLFPERQNSGQASTEYYRIIAELAKLNRMELGKFKERFALSMEKAKENIFAIPYRFVASRTGCGFVFVPLETRIASNRRAALVNLTQAHKYDQKLKRCIGLSFVSAEEGWFDVEWCYLDFDWVQNEAMSEMLGRSFPFRDVREASVPRYTFRNS